MIRVRALSKSFGRTAVLRGIDFDVREGALVALLGASGAGKSTLLRCLSGLDEIDGGSIALGDLEARGARELRGRVGLVFQSFELFPHLTARQNCTLAPVQVRRVPKDEADRRATRLLDELGLGDKLDAYPDHLSGGQRQRVAIARALAMEPRVLLYDEPTSALDPSLRAEVQTTLARVRATGVTQIVVTHDLALARDTADLALVLDEGRVAEAGPARELLTAPKSAITRRLLDRAS